MKEKDFSPTNSQLILYADQSGKVKLDVRMDGDTVWLSQKMMAEQFACSPNNVGLHLKNIFRDGELDPESVAEDFSVTASDGKTYRVKHFNLDAIISIGYRVNSGRATQFRIWATKTLREFLIKGMGECLVKCLHVLTFGSMFALVICRGYEGERF